MNLPADEGMKAYRSGTILISRPAGIPAAAFW
jgi:hypothetical protein